MKHKYYKKLDILRVVACISVLLYHVGLLKGGYLAVCTFFVLSGFLACTSAFKRKNFSFIIYYKNRLKKIYLPLLIVVFLSVFAIKLIPSINWFNLKTETTSVLFCYNNYWQIGANLDYFARSANSPFTHFWYVSILLQFDLIFPFLYLGLKYIGEKTKKIIPCFILGFLSILSFIFFYKLNTSGNFNSSYYDSFARSFSLLIGLTAGFIYSYYKNSLPYLKKDSELVSRMFLSFLLVMVCLFFSIDSSFYYFPIIMLLVSLISTTLIFYAMSDDKRDDSKKMRVVKTLSNISYEVYLVQYPVIYILENLQWGKGIGVIFTIIFILFLSYVLYYSFNIKWYEKDTVKKIKVRVRNTIIFIASIGFLLFVFSNNNKLEMKRLEEELLKREETIQKSKENYEKLKEDELNKHLASLEDYDKMINNIDETVLSLPIIGVGDSIMLGAVDNLYKQFKNGYFDAEVSRSILKAKGILDDLNSKGILNGPIVINLGANGDCSKDCKLKIIEAARDNQIFWVTVTNDKSVHINDKLKELANEVDNFHIIDWETISAGHKEYFYADGIHLTGSGRKAYTEALYNAIKTVYLDEIMSKREKLQQEFDDSNKSKITFFGNDLLLYTFDKLEETFNSSVFNIDKDYTYDSLKNKISSLIEEDSLSNKIVLVFDRSANLGINEYKSILELCQNYEVFVVSMNDKQTSSLENIKNANFELINFSKEISNNKDYLLKDNIHLSEEGNEALVLMLQDKLVSNN